MNDAANAAGSRSAPSSGPPGFLRRLKRRFGEDNVPAEAAAVAFFGFLSFPPAVVVIFALTGFFGGPEVADWLTGQLRAGLPEEAASLIDGFVAQVVRERAPGAFSIGAVLALWAASAVFATAGQALDRMFGVRERRSWIRQRLVAVGVMLLFALLFLGGSVVLLAGPGIAAGLDLWGTAETMWKVGQWPLAFLMIAAAFWIGYHFLPARDQSGQRKRLAAGAVTGAFLWIVATIGFRLYISSFGNYTETYGILGTMIVLLLWMWISGIVGLLGAEIAAELGPARRAPRR